MTPESIQLSQEIEALQRRRDEVAALYGKHEGWQVYVGGVYGAASKDTG